MSLKNDITREVDARTNQPVDRLDHDVDSHDDYLALREAFSHLPPTPAFLHIDEAPVQHEHGRFYNWLVTPEQSGGSIALHILNVEPGFVADDHHHSSEEEFFYVLEGELEITVGTETRVGGPGTFAYVPPYATHAFRATDTTCRVLHWNTPGGHERLAPDMNRLRDSQNVTPESVQNCMEAHEYFFHNEQVFVDNAARLNGKK